LSGARVIAGTQILLILRGASGAHVLNHEQLEADTRNIDSAPDIGADALVRDGSLLGNGIINGVSLNSWVDAIWPREWA
jgi:hypothetical protein